MAEILSVMSSVGKFHSQLGLAQISPVSTSSESPGRKKPINRPVSTKTMTFRTMKAGIAYCGWLRTIINALVSNVKIACRMGPKNRSKNPPSRSGSTAPMFPWANADSWQATQRSAMALDQARKRRILFCMMRFLHRREDTSPCHSMQITQGGSSCKEQIADAQVKGAFVGWVERTSR